MATQQARYSNPPRIQYVDRGEPDADDVPPAQRTAASTGVPVNYTRPTVVPPRTTGPMVQTPGGPVTKVVIRSFDEALRRWPLVARDGAAG
jgi:hypothetical protein